MRRLAHLVIRKTDGMHERIDHGQEIAVGRIIGPPSDVIERIGDLRHAVEGRLTFEERRHVNGF